MKDTIELLGKDKFVCLPELLFFIEGLSSSQKLLLLFLGTLSNDGIYSLTHLSNICGVTKQTIIRNLKFFEWLSWIEISRSKSQDYGNNANHYSLKIENVKKTLQFCKDNNIKLNVLEKEFNDLKK